MTIRHFNLIILFLGLFQATVFSKEIDSLKAVYTTSSDQNHKFETAIRISFLTSNVDNEASFYYAEQAMLIAEETNKPTDYARSYQAMGRFYNTAGHFTKALDLLFEALTIYKDLNDHHSMARVNNTIANVYFSMDKDEDAKTHYLQAYDAGVLSNDSLATAIPLIGLSVVSAKQGYFKEAIAYSHNANAYINVEERPDAKAACYFNLADYYYQSGYKDDAKEWFDQGVKTNAICKNQYIRGEALIILSGWASDKGQYKIAIEKAKEAIRVLRNIDSKPNELKAVKHLAKIYEKAGDYKNGFHYLERHAEIKDSLDDQNRISVMEKMDLEEKTVQREKKIVQLKTKNEIQVYESRANSFVILVTALSFLFIGTLVLMVLYFFKKKNNLQKQLKEQLVINETINNLSTISAQYAQRIQSSFLPEINTLEKAFSKSYIFHKPQHKLGGDFYWFKRSNDDVWLAVADCTGKEVAGAFVSIVCKNALDLSIELHGIKQPSLILEKTRELVIDAFKTSNKNAEDGMSISLLHVNLKTTKIQWAGAYNPLVIARRNMDFDLTILKGDTQPVANFKTENSFTNHEIQLDKGDLLFLFTDGYKAQFGGPKNKKYNATRFEQLLNRIAKQPFSNQKRLIRKEFENWKEKNPQTDDVCILGVKV